MRVIAERDLEARMRDGTVLRADVYRPDGPGKFPVVLQRTPYDKQREIFLIHGREFAKNGYVAVFQAYADVEYRAVLTEHGFDAVRRFSSLEGRECEEIESDLFAMVAKKQ
ncbi:MAG: hypothetical protein HQ548_07385 [Chloroflexi bacterium]|nr:hypothetical protein [Chloroflexota bacterium]